MVAILQSSVIGWFVHLNYSIGQSEHLHLFLQAPLLGPPVEMLLPIATQRSNCCHRLLYQHPMCNHHVNKHVTIYSKHVTIYSKYVTIYSKHATIFSNKQYHMLTDGQLLTCKYVKLSTMCVSNRKLPHKITKLKISQTLLPCRTLSLFKPCMVKNLATKHYSYGT